MYKIIDLQIKGDNRGSLVAIEEDHTIPFNIKRVYYIFGTKKNVTRGYHAHFDLKQLLISVKGSCKVLLDDGNNKKNIILDSPASGLLLENMIWREMYEFSSDCVLLVLANKIYDENDYIRDYSSFLKHIKGI